MYCTVLVHFSSYYYQAIQSISFYIVPPISVTVIYYVLLSTHLLPVMRGPGSIPGGYLCETGILLLALSHYTHTQNYEIEVYQEE
jgi:hypothetical protein